MLIHPYHTTALRRMAAMVVDYLIFLVPLAFMQNAQAALGDAQDAKWWLDGLEIAFTILPILYSIFFHVKTGWTLGKRLFGLKVVEEGTLRPITYRQGILRDSGLILFFLIGVGVAYVRSKQWVNVDHLFFKGMVALCEKMDVFWALAEAVTLCTNAKQRSLQDYLAGTIVVRTSAKG